MNPNATSQSASLPSSLNAYSTRKDPNKELIVCLTKVKSLLESHQGKQASEISWMERFLVIQASCLAVHYTRNGADLRSLHSVNPNYPDQTAFDLIGELQDTAKKMGFKEIEENCEEIVSMFEKSQAVSRCSPLPSSSLFQAQESAPHAHLNTTAAYTPPPCLLIIQLGCCASFY